MDSTNVVQTSGFQNAQVQPSIQEAKILRIPKRKSDFSARLISRIGFRNVLPFWFSEAKQKMGKEFYIKINSKENKDKWKK